MKTLNEVTLLGAVGADPEMRAAGDSRVASFSLATSESWTKDGEKQEKTQWHRCSAWNRGKYTLADIVERYVRKGSKVLVKGKIEYRQWQDKDGATRYSTEIVVSDLILLDGKTSGEDRVPMRAGATAGAKKNAAETFEDFPGALEEEDDDLPF